MYKVESFLKRNHDMSVSMMNVLSIIDHSQTCELPGCFARQRLHFLRRHRHETHKKFSFQELRDVLDYQRAFGGRIEDVLVNMGLVSEEDILQELTVHYGLAYLPPTHYRLDFDVLKIIPVEVARHYCVLPLEQSSGVLTVLMANPLNALAIKDLERLTGCSILPMVAKASEIRKAIEESYLDRQGSV